MGRAVVAAGEVRERAVRMVPEQHGEHPLLWAATQSIAAMVACAPHTLYDGVTHRRGPWKTRWAVETATLNWVT